MGKKGSMLLKFKGDKEPAVSLSKKKKKKKTKQDHGVVITQKLGQDHDIRTTDEQQQEQEQTSSEATEQIPSMSSLCAVGAGAHSSSQPQPSSPPPPSAALPQMKLGTGRITTSGTVVMGHNTKFIKELNVGDAIIISDGEMRIVKMRLSDISISLSSAFSNDLIKPSSFHYVSKPRNYEEERRRKQAELSKLESEKSRMAFGNLYDKSDTLVYREQSSTGTSYVIRKEALGENVSRSDLLHMRSKKKSDRYCN